MSDELVDRLRELEAEAAALEPGAEERRALRDAVVGSSERFLGSVDLDTGDLDTGDHRRAFEEMADPASGLLDLPIAEHGRGVADVLRLFDEEVVRPGGHPAAPGHLAYLSGGGLYHAALADYLGAVSNKYAGLFFTGPGPVRMENLLVRWVADLVGYPASAGGALLSGGSLANLTAVLAARDAHRLRSADYAKAVVYRSEQTHHAIDKALRVAGLADCTVRSVELDRGFRMRPEALAAAIAADRARGLRPWLVVATAGSTDTGAVDPLDAIATISGREGCWLHVDAAYGGFFLLTADGRRALRGLERSDSAVLDPHKSLFLPWGLGIVVARDVATLRAADDDTGHYLQDARDGGVVSPADVSPELTKPFRALRMWLPLVLLGTAPFRAALEEKLLLARYFHREVARLGFEVAPPPDLSVVAFRWAPPGLAPEAADRVNRDILEALRRDGRIFLSSTLLDGRYTLRAAPLAHRTHLRTVDLALELLAEQVSALG